MSEERVLVCTKSEQPQTITGLETTLNTLGLEGYFLIMDPHEINSILGKTVGASSGFNSVLKAEMAKFYFNRIVGL